MWGTVLKWAVTKAAPAASLISPFGMYIKIGMISVLVGVVGTHLWNDRTRAKDLITIRSDLAKVEQSNAQLQHTLGQNKIVVEECLKTNEWNANQSLLHEKQANEALANVILLRAINDRDTEDIIRETDELRNKDENCRTADEPLPDWLLPSSLWDN